MPRPARPSASAAKPAAPPSAPAASTQAPGRELQVSWINEHIHKADVPYRILVVALAFLLGSFVASNADAWTSLATGRLLAEGKYTFGVDPFSYMTEAPTGRRPVAWINHSWLYSWICYLLYGFNGAVLIVAKALCLAGVALLMLRAGPGNRHGWAGTWGVLLAILVVSAQAQLQPIMISFLFFAATLLVLYKAGILSAEDANTKPKLLWALPFLFALWVNLDAWFFLGPLTLYLCIVTDGVWRVVKREKRLIVRPRPSLVLAVSLLACLANPHHYHALFTLPPELGYLLGQMGNIWPESLVAGGSTYRFTGGQTLTPFSKAFWLQTADGGNVAGVSFVILLVLVAASFYFCKPAPLKLLVVRAVPTAFFALLSLAMAKLMPWFAMVGGMVLMWNVQEFLARRETEKPARIQEQDRWANASRLAMGFALFGLLFLAWPGWVNFTIGDYASPRRVGWSVQEDVSLKNAARFLLAQHAKGSLNRGFNTSPDLAAYCAFHADDFKMFMDQRVALFDRVLPLYARIRKGLDEETETTPINPWGSSAVISFTGLSGWRDDLFRNRIDYIAGTDFVAGKLMLWTLRFPVGEFETIYADGKTFVIAWNRDSKKRNSFKDKGQEITQRWQEEVFGKHEGSWPKPVPSLPPLAGDPGFWSLYLFGHKKASPASQEAKMLLDVHETLIKAPPWVPFYVAGWLTSYWSLPAGVATGPCALTSYPWFTFEYSKVARFQGSDLGSPAALLLSLRIARRALAEDPEDADSYRCLVLGTGQIETTLEGFWSRGESAGNLRAKLRKCQFVAALQQYLLLNRRDFEAHWTLGLHLYKEGCYDLAVKHLDESVKLMKALDDPALKDLRTLRENQLAEARMQLDERMREFSFLTAQASDLEKVAQAAFRPYQFEADGRLVTDPRGMGLQGKAWEILEGLVNRWATLPEAEQQQVAEFYVPLALNLGYLPQVDRIIRSAPELKPQEMLFLSAAEFDFRLADDALSALNAREEKPLQMRASVGVAGPLMLLMEPTFGSLPASPLLVQLASVRAGELHTYQANVAELHGLFALEAGKTLSARRYFAASLKLSQSAGPPFPEGKIARRYLQLLADDLIK